jgi:hypothetical protein
MALNHTVNRIKRILTILKLDCKTSDNAEKIKELEALVSLLEKEIKNEICDCK